MGRVAVSSGDNIAMLSRLVSMETAAWNARSRGCASGDAHAIQTVSSHVRRAAGRAVDYCV
jgi:hypothetical protein